MQFYVTVVNRRNPIDDNIPLCFINVTSLRARVPAYTVYYHHEYRGIHARARRHGLRRDAARARDVRGVRLGPPAFFFFFFSHHDARRLVTCCRTYRTTTETIGGGPRVVLIRHARDRLFVISNSCVLTSRFEDEN